MRVYNKAISIMIAMALSGVVFVGLAAGDAGPGSEAVSGASENHSREGHAGGAHASEENAGGHNEHEEEVVRLSEKELEEFGIQTAVAGPGTLDIYVTLPGEVTPNADMVVHVVPRVPGVVRAVRKDLGDMVEAGEVIAVLESRELSDVKAEYLGANERLSLAEANYAREERLWKKRVSSERDYLKAKQELAETRITLRSSEQKLHALGFSEEYLKRLPTHSDATFTLYDITAPFEGTVIEKHVTLGEAVQSHSRMFIIADLSTVWVNLNVYQKDLAFVHKGAKVTITSGHGIPDVTGIISYVSPIIDEQTRTALARIVLPNENRELRPGLFITGRVVVDNTSVPVIAPKTALQTYEGKTVVFVETNKGFEPKPVAVGLSDATNVEIISGLSQGQKYVSKGAFTLKAQLSKGAFGGGHSH